MSKYLKIGIPILLIIVVLFILYYLGFIKIKFKNGELFSSSTKSICKPLVIKNTAYNNDTKKSLESKYYLSDKKHGGDTESGKYFALIENIQPFYNQKDSRYDFDEISEVKQSLNHIWCLNTARNQIMKAKCFKSDHYNNLKFVPMIKKYTNTSNSLKEAEDLLLENNKLRYITAFGVSQSSNENHQYCVLGISDFVNPANSFLVIFSDKYDAPTEESQENKMIDLYIDEDKLEELSDLSNVDLSLSPKYIKITNQLPIGNIIINKSDIQKEEGDESSDSESLKFDLVYSTLKLINDNNLDNNIVNKTVLQKKQLIFKNSLIEIKDKLTDEVVKDLIDNTDFNNKDIKKLDTLKQIEKVKVYLASNEEENDKQNTTKIDNLKNLYDNVWSYNPLYNITFEDGDNDIEHDFKISMYYKFMNRVIDFICSKTIKLGYIDIKQVGKNYNFIIGDIDSNKNYKLYIQNIDNLKDETLTNIVKSSEININEQKVNLNNLGNIIDISKKLYDEIGGELNYNIKDIDLNVIKDNLKYIHEKTEMISDEKVKEEVRNLMNDSYNIDVNSLYFNHNIIGILDFNGIDEKTYPQKLITEKIPQERKVLFILHQHITHDENLDENDEEKELIYGRYLLKKTAPYKYNLIPSIKFNYGESFLTESKSKKISLLTFFRMKQSKVNANNNIEFKNYYDWIDIYSFLKKTGHYYPQKYNILKLNKTDMFIGLKNGLNEKFTKKHQNILNSDEFNEIFDVDLKGLGKYPNFEIYTGKTDIIPNDDDQEVFISPRIKDITTKDDYQTEDNNVTHKDIKYREKYYLGLDEFNTSEDDTPMNTSTYDGKTYYYYKLILDSKETIDNLNTDEVILKLKQDKYTWQKRIINNFKDFKDLILNNDESKDFTQMETLDRDRVRGLLELDDKYVDDYYLLFLEYYKQDIIKKLPMYKIEEFESLLSSKKELLNELGVYAGSGNVRTNPLGYPFHVIFKYIDYRGKTCTPGVKRKQKLFLINILEKEHFDEDKYKEVYKLGKSFQSKRYPFVKQEFMSFTGYGNLIQFNLSKPGGITDIEAKKICGGSNSSFMMGCNTDGDSNSNGDGNEDCTPKKLGFINLDGTPKCEIVAKDVKKASETSVETLLVGSVDVNACNIYLNKGDHKLYFKLGRVFLNAGEKIQIPNTYTIQDENNKFVYVDGNVIKRSGSVNEDSDKISSYYFEGILKQDNYGTYMTFNPQNKKSEFLTAKIDIFTNKLAPLSLENEIKDEDRNLISDNYKKDKSYYSQKFIVPEALVRNMAANDGTANPKIKEYMRQQEEISRVIGSFGLDGITTGSTEYTTGLSPEEEAKIIEEQLGNLRLYLNNLNTVFQEEKFDIEGLKTSLKVIKEQIEERIPFIEKRLQNIKYIVSVSENLKKRDMRLKTDNTYDESKERFKRLKEEKLQKKEEKKNLDNTKGQNMNKEFENTQSALEALKGFFNKENKAKQEKRDKLKKEIEQLKESSGKCKREIIENFDGQYDTLAKNKKYTNHVVDKYQTYLKNEVEKSKNELEEKNNRFKSYLTKLEGVTKAVKHDSKKTELLMSELIDKNNNINHDVSDLKNSHIESKINKIKDKKKILEILKCRLGFEGNTKEDSNYRSIISRYDGELLTTYELQKDDKSPEEKDLDVNMLLINGGCLSFDQDNNKLNIEHCMIGDKNQHFNVKNVKSVDDLKKLNLDHSKGFDKSFSIISQPNKNRPEKPKKKCDKIQPDFCLHKENGEVSMRNCDNIKNQQWIYSNISGSCN